MTVTEAPRNITGSEAGPREKQLHPVFLHDSYKIRQRFFRWGTTYDLSDGSGNFLIRARRNPMRFTRNFSLYVDKARENKILSLDTRGSIPETYDVTDGGEKIGAIRHKPLSFIPYTNWEIVLPGEPGEEQKVIGKLRHRSGYTYEIVTPDNKEVAVIQRNFKTFGVKLTMNILDPDPPIDRRLLAAANVIMAQRAYEKKERG